MKITTEVFKQQMLERNSNIEVLENYVDDKTPIKVECKICKNIWKDSPTHLKLGRGCSACKKLERQKLQGKLFIQKAENLHNNKYKYYKVDYIKAQEKVCIICPEHGDFYLTPNSHLNGRGCPYCSNNNFLKTTKLFIIDAKAIHGDDYDYSKVVYKGANIPVEIICNKCNNIFWQTPDTHINGKHGCTKCKLKSQTKLFLKLKESFPNLDILFEVGSTVVPWLEHQRFDIYIPSLNVAIEYNGLQHYLPIEYFHGLEGFEIILERDNRKRLKCAENNCSLFEIKYNYTDKDYNTLVSDLLKLIINKLSN